MHISSYNKNKKTKTAIQTPGHERNADWYQMLDQFHAAINTDMKKFLDNKIFDLI